ncbi:MAG: tetratricopeptide repeat protein [Nitrospiria bacterium]
MDKSAIIQNAQKYTAKGQIEKAIEEWQRLIAETPNDGNIYNTIGDLYLKKNSPKQAIGSYLKAAEAYDKAGFALKTIAVYKKVIKIDPRRIEAYVKLADLHAERGLTGNAIEDYMTVAKHYAREGKVRESLDIYRKIADLDPSNVNIQIKLSELCLKEGLKNVALEGLLKAAQSCSTQGKTNEADDLYTRILEIDPANEMARVGMKDREGVNPQSQTHPPVEIHQIINPGDLDQEEKSLREALNGPEPALVQRQELGYLLLKKGDLEGALHELRQVVQEYHNGKQWGPAIQVMLDYLRKDPKRLEAHDLLAQSYEKGGLTDRAVEEYVTLIDLLISEEHSMTEAMELFNRLKDLDPQNAVIEKLRDRFGQYLNPISISASGGLEPSQGSLSHSASSPSSGGLERTGRKEVVQSYLTEAEVYIKYGLTGKALEQLKTALKVAPDNLEVHQQLKEVYGIEGKIPEIVRECLELARIYTKSKQNDQRRQILEEALELDPDNAEVKALLQAGAGESKKAPKEQKESGKGQRFGPNKSVGDQVSGGEGIESKSLWPDNSTPEVSQEKEAPELDLDDAQVEALLQAGSGEFIKAPKEQTDRGKRQSDPKKSVDDQVPGGQGIDSKTPWPHDLTPGILQKVVELFAEAEFYYQQGLKEEAKKLYQKVLALEPSHFQAQIRLLEMESVEGGSRSSQESAKAVETPVQAKDSDLPFAAQDEDSVDLVEMFMEEMADKPVPASAPKVDPAQQELESIFLEFKKGVKKQFADQDYETHYNLGIAYKEMGLITEAVEEFQLASKGQAIFIDAMSMIATCYREKGDYEPAMQQIQAILMDERCSSGHAIGLKYELAQLYELREMKKEALELYQEIYRVDKTFKDVAKRLKKLKGNAPDIPQASASLPSKKVHTEKVKSKKQKKVSYL